MSKHIEDITPEQGIQLARLIYGWDDTIVSELRPSYCDGIVTFAPGASFRENEQYSIKFDANIPPPYESDSPSRIIVHIYPQLDIDIGIYEDKGHYWSHKKSLITRNLYTVYNLLREWGIEPHPESRNREYLKDYKG